MKEVFESTALQQSARIGAALLGAPCAILGLIGFSLLAPSGLIDWAVITLVGTTLCGSLAGAFIAKTVARKKGTQSNG